MEIKRAPEWWIQWYMGLAQYVSTASKDPSTQCGAVIVRPNKTLASVGYNGMPRNISDTTELLNDREQKYQTIIHAEENALDNCEDRSVDGYSLYVYPFMPCSRCTGRLINNGIAKVYAPAATDEQIERWGKSFTLSLSMFEEAGIHLQFV